MSGRDLRTYAEKASQAWAAVGGVPDWVAELAAHADRFGAKASGEAIGYSNSTVSVVVNRGNMLAKLDLPRIEESVRGALMGLTVDCPVKGEMPRHRCLAWQAKPYALSSSARVEMYHACRSGCPHSRIIQKEIDNDR
ncbi:hypothetical protein SAMN02983003_3141 [Devosia enhydra]|uniref:Transcriptional regulator n=1 Tax=Devosia enhydra TaxID=665118 RepID=A0A1K2I0X0_9HYPH|nr:hypothetical protein [Devosia enhydra]SFZ85969.1 hypothetical protein SAMN02983003_3141 [Devosia enhydra]